MNTSPVLARRPRGRPTARVVFSARRTERFIRGFSAALLAVAIVAAALESVSHVHRDGGAHGPAASPDVPVSLIVAPDAPSAQQHWHAGYTFAPEFCAACVLLAQAGCVPAAAAQAAVEPADRLCVTAACTPFGVSQVGIDCRAPPRLA
jgi:hypothetical protein